MLTKEIRSRIDWIGLPADDHTRMLDYACGTGLVSLVRVGFCLITMFIDVANNTLRRLLHLMSPR